jgi:hypothetical protein
MSVNQFIKNMAAAGFTGEFKATNGEQTYRGSIEVGGKISTIKVQSVEESRRKIQEMLYANKTN